MNNCFLHPYTLMKTKLWGEKMKKYFVFGMLFLILFVTGCSKGGEQDVIKDLDKKLGNAKAYQVQGKLEITNNEDTYHYDVVASFKKDYQYRVSLKNTANNHEQIILKNTEGVYVLTPSLNKSFKFQSDWPYNTSQIYLLKSIVDDIKNDDQRNFVADDNGYVFTTTVNYPNNHNLVKQKVTFDKDLNIKQVEVMNDADVPQMIMTFHSVDLNPTFDSKYFDLNQVMQTCDTCKQTDDNSSDENNTTGDANNSKETSVLEDIIFPLYLPSGTKLADQDKVTTTNGERVILTFDGEKPFLLVEETVDIPDELSIIPTYGEPYFLIDTVGALSDNSISWTSGGIDYYMVSDVMSQQELVEVARSISAIPTMK